MTTTYKKKLGLKIFTLSCLATLAGCAEFNDPYDGGGGYYGSRDPYYDDYRYRNDYDRRRDREDRREIERERRRVEEDRRRLEEERNRRPPPPPPPSRNNDRCPSGFSPSENKCSPQERRRGCRDIRLPSGLGCVSR